MDVDLNQLTAMTNEEMVERLTKRAEQIDGVIASVKRRRNLRDSEKAMWLSDLGRDKLAMLRAVNYINGKTA